MEILGIGPLELLFIVLIALIILGPKDMVQAGRTIGTWLRKLVSSPGWQVFLKTSRELRYLPNKLMRDANEELQNITNDIQKSVPMEEFDVSLKSYAPIRDWKKEQFDEPEKRIAPASNPDADPEKRIGPASNPDADPDPEQ